MRLHSIYYKARVYEEAALQSFVVYLDAHRFIRNHHLRKYLLLSGISFLLFFTLSIKAIMHGIEYLETPLSQKLLPYLPQWIPFSTDEIRKGIQALLWLIKQTIDGNKYAIFSALFLLLGVPFLSYISAKTEEIHRGNSYPFRFKTFIREVQRGVDISLRTFLKQGVLILSITLLALLPVADSITPLLSFLVQAYYNGVIMTDYTLERQGYTVRESQVFYTQHKPQMFAIGVGYMFLLIIPVVGWFIAPTYSIVSSYLYFSHSQEKHS